MLAFDKSVSDPLCLSIFINDAVLFIQECNLTDYADESTMDISNKSISYIINCLSHEFIVLPKWFYNNFMVLNPNDCSFKLLVVLDELQSLLICGNDTLRNSRHKKKKKD